MGLRHELGCAERPPNYQSSFCRWPWNGASGVCTFPRSTEGVTRRLSGCAWRHPISMHTSNLRCSRNRLDGLQVHSGSADAAPGTCRRPASPSSTSRRPHHVQAAVGDLLDLLGHHGGPELILNAIHSSSHQPLRAGRRAWSLPTLLTFELAWSPEGVRRGHEKSPHCPILSPPRQPEIVLTVCRCTPVRRPLLLPRDGMPD